MKTLTILTLLIVSLLALSCADTPTAPALTESEIEALIDERLAQEIAKMNGNHEDVLTPQEIAVIALKSTVYLRIRKLNKFYISTGFVIDAEQIVTCYHVIKDMEKRHSRVGT